MAPVAANTSSKAKGKWVEVCVGRGACRLWHLGGKEEEHISGVWRTLEPPTGKVGAARRLVPEHPAHGAVGLAGQPDERVAVAIRLVVRGAVAPCPPDERADAPARLTRGAGKEKGGLTQRVFSVWAEGRGAHASSRFLSRMLRVFFTRTEPASSTPNPACQEGLRC